MFFEAGVEKKSLSEFCYMACITADLSPLAFFGKLFTVSMGTMGLLRAKSSIAISSVYFSLASIVQIWFFFRVIVSH